MLKKIYNLYKNEETKQTFKKYSKNNKILKLQLGAGNMYLKGWFNTDLHPNKEKNIYYLNMLKPFPFKNNSFDYIYSEHNIEHFELNETYKILKECLRILKPKGIIRIATPNLEKMITMYQGNSECYDNYCTWEVDTFIPFAKKMKIYNKAIVLNNFFRCWGHKFIYDGKTLSDMLKLTGFQNIKGNEIHKSKYYELNNIEMHQKIISEDFYKIETMVFEAEKP